MRTKHLDSDDYTIGWICALPIEFAAAVAFLDARHPALPFSKYDDNAYEFGQIGHVNIVVAGLPSGVYGVTSAATVATNMRRSFPGLQAGLMVGIGGGAPLLPQNDIRLGDVVVSHPTPGYGGVLQYDFGKTVQEGRFVQTGVLNKPPNIFLQAITKLKSEYLLLGRNTLNEIIDQIFDDGCMDSNDFSRPPLETDRLFKSDYDHPYRNVSCKECDKDMIVDRPLGRIDQPYIHYGLIASGNQVMKHGATRDKLSKDQDVLCFEMEAAGLMDELPSLIVRGICDYSDSHKNKAWQPYAALVAAAYAKELLLRLPIRDVEDRGRGRGKQHRRRRGRSESAGIPANEVYQCLRGLNATNPGDDKTRIERAKDKLVEASYSWILEHPDFHEWYSGQGEPILWISGDLGKGKTMMMIGVANYLQAATNDSESKALTYFFCQAGDPRLNTAVAVLKGLLNQLLRDERNKRLIKYLKKEYNVSGPDCFDSVNAFDTLQRVFTDILEDDNFTCFYCLIDALDECKKGLDELLGFLTDIVQDNSKIRWLVASRNRPDIEERLEYHTSQIRVSLESNSKLVSKAVREYVRSKISDLTRMKRYDPDLQEQLIDILEERAEGTFLWVHLACKELAKVKAYKAISAIKALPLGLERFYKEMHQQIETLNEGEEVFLCSQILSTVLLSCRPLRLMEMAIIASMPNTMNEDELEEQVKQCGSFLIVQDRTISFVHESAKDYLDTQTGSKIILPNGKNKQQTRIVELSLKCLSRELRPDICNWSASGFLTEKLSYEDTEHIMHLEYACCHWVDHFNLMEAIHPDEQSRISYFVREHLLNWLETLSVFKSSQSVVSSIQQMEDKIKSQEHKNHDLINLLHDIGRFISYNQSILKMAPLQIRASALTFAPDSSFVKGLFPQPSWVIRPPVLTGSWSPMIQAIEGHAWGITCLAISSDGKYLASGSTDGEVRLWDIISGTLARPLSNASYEIRTLEFSPDGKRLVSGDNFKKLDFWDVISGKLVKELSIEDETITTAKYSLDGKLIAVAVGESVCAPSAIQMWEIESYRLVQEFETGSANMIALVFPPEKDNQIISVSKWGASVRFWNLATGVQEQCIDLGSKELFGTTHQIATFSPDFKKLLFTYTGEAIRGNLDLWDLESGKRIWRAKGHTDNINGTAWSRDSKHLVTVSQDHSINLWDHETGKLLGTLNNLSRVRSVTFSKDSKLLITGANWKDPAIRVWDMDLVYRTDKPTKIFHDGSVHCLGLSTNKKILASGSRDSTVKLWDTFSGALIHTLENHEDPVMGLHFSSDDQILITSDTVEMIVWETASWKVVEVYKGKYRCFGFIPGTHHALITDYNRLELYLRDVSNGVILRAFSWGDPSADRDRSTFLDTPPRIDSAVISNDGGLVVTADSKRGCTLRLWSAEFGVTLKTPQLPGRGRHQCTDISFSNDDSQIVVVSEAETIAVWDVASLSPIRGLELDIPVINLRYSSDGHFLETDSGTVNLQAALDAFKTQGRRAKPLVKLLSGNNERASITLKDSWFRFNGQPVLWAPANYRPSHGAYGGQNMLPVTGNLTAVGTEDGFVYFIELADPNK